MFMWLFLFIFFSMISTQTDWKLWPTAQAINFFFVPTKLRVTYVNSVTFIWTVYLSYMKHKVSVGAYQAFNFLLSLSSSFKKLTWHYYVNKCAP